MIRNIGEQFYQRPDYFLCNLKILIRVTRIIVVIVFCFIGLPLAEAFSAQTDETGIIQSKNLHLRLKPSLHSRSLKILHRGTRVNIVKYDNGWVQVRHKGKYGYVRNREKYILIQKPVEKKPDNVTNISKTKEQYQKKAESIDLEIKKSSAEILLITKKERNIIESLNDIKMALSNAIKNSLMVRSDLDDLLKKTAKTRKEIVVLLEKVKINEVYASRRLVALYKLNWLGKLHIIASAESVFELSQRKTALERILGNDENILKSLSDNRNRLDQLLNRQNAQRMKKLSLEREYTNQVRIMTEEKAKRATLLSAIRSQKTLELAYIESLKERAKALDWKIKALSQEQPQPISEKGPIAKDFVKYKGLLNMPVKGKIISHFGSYRNAKFNVTNFRSGIDIKADRGEPIKAVSAGRIIFAGWFKGYGNMIIINHDMKYYTVYANIEEIFKKQGSEVENGEVIATVGDTGPGVGSKLYFEVRHHGKPVDPLEWIRKS